MRVVDGESLGRLAAVLILGGLPMVVVMSCVSLRARRARRGDGGKAAGILTLDQELQTQCRDLGATFIATEIDVKLFAQNMRASAADAAKRFR